MAAPTRSTHVIEHKKQYLMVEGKLQHVPKGTEVVLDLKTAKSLEGKGRVLKLGKGKQIDLTKSGDKPDFSKMNLKQLKAACKKAKIDFANDAKEEDLIKLLEAPAE